MRRFYLLFLLLVSFWELNAQYCTPTAGSSSQSYYLKTINLTDQSSINYSASSYQSYVDNSSQQVNSYAGGNLQVYLETSSSTAKYYVYVDWNNDFDFDDAEENPIATTSYAANYTGAISVPVGQAQGSYRVRIENGYITPTSPINACGPSNYGNFVDFTIQVGPAPTCLPPTAITSSNVTVNTANISWTAPASVPGNGYEYYYSTTNTAPTNTTTPSGSSATTSASLSGLSAATNYYVWVRSVCSASDRSAWSYQPGTFLTGCAPMTDMFENFDTYATGNIVPTCWFRMTGTGSQTISSTTPASGTRNIYQYATASQNPVIVALPEFSNVNAGTHWLRFKARVSSGAPGSLNVGYVTDINDPNTFVVLQALTINNTSYTGSGAEYTVQIPTTVPANARLAIGNAADGKSYYWDDVYWEPAPTCFAPTSVVASAVTTNTADISWMAPATIPANGYEYYYSTSSTDPIATTTPSGTSAGTSASISGLSPSTNYYVWVRSVCSSTDRSAWSSYGTFITACAPMADMFENFDTYTTGNIVPTCWYRMTGTGSQTITSTTPASGTRNIYQYASASQTPVIVALPEFSNINAGTHWLRFKARVSSGAPGSLDVGYVTDVNDPNSFVILQTLTINNTSYTAPDAEYTVPVPTTVPANARLAIRNATDSKSYYWDDVYWEQAPTCFAPTSVTASNIAANTADISWTAPAAAPANGYEYYYSTSSTAPTSTTTPSGTSATTSASLAGLSPITTYYVWVRSACSASDKSAWSATVETFQTLCQPPAILSTAGATICGASGTATISATADPGAIITWYDAATGGTELGTGNSYTTPSISSTTTYYVSAKSNGGVDTVGPVNPSALGSISATNYAISTYYQIFDVTVPTTLISVDVFPVSSVAIGTTSSIEIRDNSGATLISVPYTVSVNDGVTPQTVVLNYALPVGTGYRIGQGTGINLNRNTAGATYPYTSSAINVTGNNFSSGPNYWYYIYNWQFSSSCESARQSVTVTVDPACLGTSEVADSKNNIKVYPNPFTDVLNISDIAKVKSVSVTDVAGRLVKTIANPGSSIHLGELNSGMYLVTLEMKDGTKQSIKVIKK